MYNVLFDIEQFKRFILFQKPFFWRNGFNLPESSLHEFYELLFTPSLGAHPTSHRHPTLVKIFDRTNPVAPEHWSHSFYGDEGRYRDPEAIKKAIELKCSIVFDQYYRYSQSAATLVSFLQESINCDSGCNAYLSQKNGEAFPIHRDCHHVLIFALSGKKLWRIYNSKQPMWLAQNRVESTLTDEQIIGDGEELTIEMAPGDVLYIPIGQFHQVENLEDHSLHLTVSLNFRSAYTVFEDAVAELNSGALGGDGRQLLSETWNLVNKPHPVHTNQKPLTANDLMPELEKIFDQLRAIARQTRFVEQQNSVQRNKQLQALPCPSKSFIDEILNRGSD